MVKMDFPQKGDAPRFHVNVRECSLIKPRWLVGWLVGWLDGWMVGWLAGWLAGWLYLCGNQTERGFKEPTWLHIIRVTASCRSETNGPKLPTVQQAHTRSKSLCYE